MFIDTHIHQAVNVAYKLHGGVGVTDVEILRPRIEDSVAEYAEQILSRFSVFDLREVTDDDMDAAMTRLDRSSGFIGVLRSGERNLIQWFEVVSARENHPVVEATTPLLRKEGSRMYEVRRFETFWFCSCAGFTLSRTCCKHIAFIQHSQTRKVRNYDNSSR